LFENKPSGNPGQNLSGLNYFTREIIKEPDRGGFLFQEHSTDKNIRGQQVVFKKAAMQKLCTYATGSGPYNMY
jgi:hypothetical protein